jgi:hypothetical protein
LQAEARGFFSDRTADMVKRGKESGQKATAEPPLAPKTAEPVKAKAKDAVFPSLVDSTARVAELIPRLVERNLRQSLANHFQRKKVPFTASIESTSHNFSPQVATVGDLAAMSADKVSELIIPMPMITVQRVLANFAKKQQSFEAAKASLSAKAKSEAQPEARVIVVNIDRGKAEYTQYY